MTAETVVRKLLEGEDFGGLEPGDLEPAATRSEFEGGLKYILRQAGDLYDRLDQNGVLRVLRDERNYDQDSLTSAVLRLALERDGSLGAERAYKRIKRVGKYII